MKRAYEHDHLVLAAGEVAGEYVLALLQAREIAVDPVEVAPDGGAAVAARESAGEQILLDGEMAEAVAAFHHLDDAAAHQVVGRELVDALSRIGDAALGDLAALG